MLIRLKHEVDESSCGQNIALASHTLCHADWTWLGKGKEVTMLLGNRIVMGINVGMGGSEEWRQIYGLVYSDRS